MTRKTEMCAIFLSKNGTFGCLCAMSLFLHVGNVVSTHGVCSVCRWGLRTLHMGSAAPADGVCFRIALQRYNISKGNCPVMSCYVLLCPDKRVTEGQAGTFLGFMFPVYFTCFLRPVPAGQQASLVFLKGYIYYKYYL